MLTLEEFNSYHGNGVFTIENPEFHRVSNLPTFDHVISLLENFTVECSTFGLSTKVVKRMKLCKFLKLQNSNLYVFHNVKDDISMFNIIKLLIPPVKLADMRISRLYVGFEGSGSHIHEHSCAINYLIEGLKVWILFPKTVKNTAFLRNNNFLYSMIEEPPLEWFIKNEALLKKNLENYEIKMQHPGDVFMIPDGYYHGVYNLSKVCGITYSWY